MFKTTFKWMNKYHDKGIKLRIKKYKRNIRNPKHMGKGNKQTNKQTNKTKEKPRFFFLKQLPRLLLQLSLFYSTASIEMRIYSKRCQERTV